MEKIKNIIIKTLGFLTLGFFIFAIIYVFFIQEDAEPSRLSPSEYRRMKELHDQGLINEPIPDGSGYGGKYGW